jgi:hypothetical protein
VAGVGRSPDSTAGTEPAQRSRNAGPGAFGGAGRLRAAPRGIVADELRPPRDAGRPLGVSGFSGEGEHSSLGGRAAVGQASDRRVARYGGIFRRVSAIGRVGDGALTERAVWQLVREYAAQVGIGELAPHDLRRYAESRIMPNRV